MTDDLYNRILKRVSRPSRYLGSEVNSIHKEMSGSIVRIALAFPDLYEVGGPHLGLAILYHILNQKEYVAAERVYAPDLDYADELKRLGLPLASLETRRPLNLFDLIGFTLPYELTYTNILYMLRLAHIPLRSCDRGEEHPIIAGGGPCAFNPEPLAPFFDIFAIGDGEDAVVDIADVLAEGKKIGARRDDILKRLSDIRGVYVPALFGDSPDQRPVVRKRVVKDLNSVDYPTTPIVPHGSVVHDRLSLEIDRGCTQGCRFCQAGTIYRPVRERSCEKIEDLLDKSLCSTGYDEFSLLSLSSGDYTRINAIVPGLLQKYRKRRIALALPSLRPGTISREIMEAISSIKKTGFTISVEAGTQRLRDLLNKMVTEEAVMNTASDLASLGWEHLKLYFMIGLPTETEEDIRSIHSFCLRLIKSVNRGKGRIKSINLGVGYFVPKPHTPFQWVPQERMGLLNEKMDLLRSLFKRRREFSFKKGPPQASFLEAVMAKGDRNLADVIERAFKLGCGFDGWGERFRFDLWERAFEEREIDPSYYANRGIDLDEPLPWSHIRTGVSDAFLKREYKNAFKGVLTNDCRAGSCNLCGLEKECKKVVAPEVSEGGPFPVKGTPSADYMVGSTVRIRFKKEGEMIYISHLDLARVMYRACLRAGLPLRYSQGFHPHPKISYASALPLGVTSLAEYADIQFTSMINPEQCRERLNGTLPKGVCVMEAEQVFPMAPSLSKSLKRVEYEARGRPVPPIENEDGLKRALQSVIEARELVIIKVRKGKEKPVDLRPFVERLDMLEFSGDSFRVGLTLKTIDSRQIQPADIFKALVNDPDKMAELDLDVVKVASIH